MVETWSPETRMVSTPTDGVRSSGIPDESRTTVAGTPTLQKSHLIVEFNQFTFPRPARNGGRHRGTLLERTNESLGCVPGGTRH